jgi:integrase
VGPDPHNIALIWARIRQRAQREGVRPLPLHAARHSWATWTLQAGKPVRWLADQLGHADASTTLNHYAHAMPEDEADLSFLDLDVAGRRYASPKSESRIEESRNPAKEWRARQDSNLRPSAPQADALSI